MVAAQTGLQLPGDLETLLGDDLVIAADRFDPNRVDPTNPDTIPIGLAMDTDRAKLDALLAKFEQSGLQLTKVGDKPTYVSLSPAYAQKLSNPEEPQQSERLWTAYTIEAVHCCAEHSSAQNFPCLLSTC